jgi:hypothetical protein
MEILIGADVDPSLPARLDFEMPAKEKSQGTMLYAYFKR